uniref:FH2 domain-containing protein n=1 Tax=Petromyzon marinus TaxID=7757 RepID=S4RZA3_PETMA
AAVSMDSVMQDVRELQRGMETTKREAALHESNVGLRRFIEANDDTLSRLVGDANTAKDAFQVAVEYFGETPKTMPPSNFFPVFSRFVNAFKKAEKENESRRLQEERKQMLEEAAKEEKNVGASINKGKRQQMNLIAELTKKQGNKRTMYEGKDGAIDSIITDIQPLTRTHIGSPRFTLTHTHISTHSHSPTLTHSPT